MVVIMVKKRENSETPFADVDKTGEGDTNLCWAAVAAICVPSSFPI
jgi:hypothetical protein